MLLDFLSHCCSRSVAVRLFCVIIGAMTQRRSAKPKLELPRGAIPARQAREVNEELDAKYGPIPVSTRGDRGETGSVGPLVDQSQG
jgi:hypothetical protein